MFPYGALMLGYYSNCKERDSASLSFEFVCRDAAEILRHLFLGFIFVPDRVK